MVHQFINEGGTPNSVPAVLSVIEPYTYASINSSGKAGPPIELVKSIIEKKIEERDQATEKMKRFGRGLMIKFAWF